MGRAGSSLPVSQRATTGVHRARYARDDRRVGNPLGPSHEGNPIRFPQGDGQITAVFAEVAPRAQLRRTCIRCRDLGDKPCRFLIVFAGQRGTPNLIRP